MPQLISQEQPVSDLYRDLLVRRRAIERLDADGTLCCDHCSMPKSNHCSDGRCSVYATSRDFLSNRHAEMEAISRGLTLIEELTQLKY